MHFVFRSLATAVLCVAAPLTAQAQDYPTKPVRLIVGLAPGGVVDLMARALAPGLGKELRQNVVVENKPGAGGSIADEYVAKQVPADGHTLLITQPAVTTYKIFTKDLRFDPIKDLNHISVLVEGHLIMWTNTQTPFGSYQELVAYLKANPGKVNFGAPGAQSYPAIMYHAWKQKLGVDFVIVPTKGTSETRVLTATNQIQIAFNDIGTSLEEIAAGRGRALLVTGPKRLPAIPSTPTTVEVGADDVLGPFWLGIAAPAATPAPVVSKIAEAVKVAMNAPELDKLLARAQFVPIMLNPEASTKRISAQAAHHQEVAKKAGIEPQ